MPDELELGENIRQCAAQCMESADPRACVNHFVRQLVAIRGWARPDAELVAHEALKVIARILHDDSIADPVTDAQDRESEVES